MAAGRTRRKPRFGGSIRNCNVTPLEYKEYEQTGMIRVKETPAEGYDFHKWEWGYHQCINFGDIIGGHEVFGTDEDDFDPPAFARLMDTWYGKIINDMITAKEGIMSADATLKVIEEIEKDLNEEVELTEEEKK